MLQDEMQAAKATWWMICQAPKTVTFINLRPVRTGHWMRIQSASMRIGCVRTANVKKPNRIKCALSQSTCWGESKPDWTGLEWNVVGRGLPNVTTCELPLWEWLLGMRTWRRRWARMWRRRLCWGSGIANGLIFFVNVVRVACTRQGHTRISFSGFALVCTEKPVRMRSNWIELDWNRFKQFALTVHWIQFAVRTGLYSALTSHHNFSSTLL